MENNSFFKTKAGRLTIAFLVIMIGFFAILAGLGTGNDTICLIGFVLMIAAMLYSPVNVYLLKPGKKDK